MGRKTVHPTPQTAPLPPPVVPVADAKTPENSPNKTVSEAVAAVQDADPSNIGLRLAEAAVRIAKADKSVTGPGKRIKFDSAGNISIEAIDPDKTTTHTHLPDGSVKTETRVSDTEATPQAKPAVTSSPAALSADFLWREYLICYALLGHGNFDHVKTDRLERIGLLLTQPVVPIKVWSERLLQVQPEAE